ncbi:hypothetical protein OW763_13050 [Clostridium aestuarii]|uniref:SbsA Ig-like domain-containing protein n=1 Tax=Clostridium aestuarii TaxID=338193 RepID=A0ABT4D1Z8_9CLOT|nr:hypothetical protein [Clostridium aestuarii]MCY6485268.1 hypothetical protein [Clostridium aestuarii]
MHLLRNKLTKTFITTFMFVFIFFLIQCFNTILTKAVTKESNNTISTANIININKQYTDSLKDKNDINYYKFTLSFDGEIGFKFTHKELNNTSTCWKVDIINEDGKEYSNLSSEGIDIKNYMSIGLPKGSYYIRIKPVNFISIPYNFILKFTQSDFFEKEFNNTLSTSNLININKQITGTLQNISDIDYYKFNLPFDGNINLEFSHEELENSYNGIYWRVSIVDENKKTYTSLVSKGTDIKNSLSVGLPKGTYYISIKPFKFINIPYNFTLHFKKTNFCEQEFNNSISTSNTIVANKEYTGTLQSVNDLDYYKFILTDNRQLTVCFTHEELSINSSSTYWTISIISKEGTERKSMVSFSDDISDSLSIGLARGTYYIRIKSSNSRLTNIPYKVILYGDFSKDTFTIKDKQTGIPSNKIWDITASKAININTIIQKNIYVTDKYGEIVPMLYYTDPKTPNTISLLPIDNYDKGKTYTLWIKDLILEGGSFLKKRTKMDFQISK